MLEIPRKARTYPASYNPLRLLYAAVVVQAIRDLANPGAGGFNRYTAHRFLVHEAPFIADEFGIPITKIRYFLQEERRYAA